MEEISRETISNIFNAIIGKAKEERRESKPYKDLFSHNDIVSLVSQARHQMERIILDTAQVLEDKHRLKINKEAYQFLQALPLLGSQVRKWIEENEGISCCEDKTRMWLGKHLESLAKKNIEESHE